MALSMDQRIQLLIENEGDGHVYRIVFALAYSLGLDMDLELR